MQTFNLLTAESAPEKSKAALRTMEARFGFLPNVLGIMANNPNLLNGFVGTFNSFHGGSFDKIERQVLLLTNAVTIKCPWTVAVHTKFATEDGVAESDVKVIREGNGLLSYGADVGDNYRRAAVHVDRILKGARLPIFPLIRRAGLNQRGLGTHRSRRGDSLCEL